MDIFEVTVSSKNQITLPKEVCNRLDLEQGKKVVFLVENKNVHIIKKPDDILKAMRELSEGKRFSSKEIREEIRKDRNQW